jgi:hypothetical protein
LVKSRFIYRPLWYGILLLTAFGFVPAAAQNDDVQITLSLDRTKIAMNETATLTVSVTGSGQAQLPEPKLPPLPQFQIFSAGSSSNIQIINGVISSSVMFNYILSPKREGTFPIRSATLLINGKRYASNELSITVVKSGEAGEDSTAEETVDQSGNKDDIFLTATVDKKSAYVDQQVTLSVKYYRAVQTLSSPDYFPPSTPGFWSNDIPPQKQFYQIINGRRYMVTELRTALFPTKPGELSISPARVSVTVPDRSRSRTRDPFSFFDGVLEQGKRVEVKSKPLTVTVKPLPLDGKTSRFSGGVGSYKISANVDKTAVEVNEAITLTVKISGQGNVKSIPEPTLPNLDGFRVEKASSDFKVSNINDQLGGTKTFEYLLIPRLSGKHVIDPIILNYFDPGQKKYKEVSTAAINLEVKKGEGVTGTEIPYNMVSGQTINLKETDIRFIKMDEGNLRKRGHLLLTSPIFIIITVIPMLAVIGGMFDTRRKRRLANDIGYARQRRAAAEARKRLKKAESFLQSSSHEAQFYAELSSAVHQFIADKFNVSAHGLTSERVKGLLEQKNIPEGLLENTLTVLHDVDFSRFAGGSEADSKERIFERVRRTIIDLGGVL